MQHTYTECYWCQKNGGLGTATVLRPRMTRFNTVINFRRLLNFTFDESFLRVLTMYLTRSNQNMNYAAKY